MMFQFFVSIAIESQDFVLGYFSIFWDVKVCQSFFSSNSLKDCDTDPHPFARKSADI